MAKSMNEWVITTLYALVRVYVCLEVYEEPMTDFKPGGGNLRLTQMKYYSKMTKKPIHFVSFLKTFWSCDSTLISDGFPNSY